MIKLPAPWVEVRETRIEIRRARDLKLITVIELLSPAIKAESG